MNRVGTICNSRDRMGYFARVTVWQLQSTDDHVFGVSKQQGDIATY